MSESRLRMKIVGACGLTAGALLCVTAIVYWQLLERHRSQIETRRALRVAIERSGRGEVLLNEPAEHNSKLIRPGNPRRSVSWLDTQLGDRHVASILFYQNPPSPNDLKDAAWFPEADIYVWTRGTIDDRPHAR